MRPKKIKKMPKLSGKSAYTRINPQGHKEMVVKRDGQDEETLNELAEIDRLCNEYIDMGDVTPAIAFEQPLSARHHNMRFTPQYVSGNNETVRANNDSITNMTGSTPMQANSPEELRAKSNLKANMYRGKRAKIDKKAIAGDKNIISYAGDDLDYGATHNEDFTGTAGIAIGPVNYDFGGSKKTRKNNKMNKKKTIGENKLSSIDRLLLEWQPEFKAGEYDPGDHQMPSPEGQGVAAKSPKQERVGRHDTETKNHGKEWPRKYATSAAMCDVEEDGVEHEPQGHHESTHGEPDDGVTTKLGHDWPAGPKMSGGGVAEPVPGNRYSDGGVLKGHTSEPSMEWSPSSIGNLLGEEHNIQSLFDNYARTNDQVNLESFQQLCDAHGIGVVMDESSFANLIHNNSEYIFYEHQDASGAFWIPAIIEESEFCERCGKECKGCKCKKMRNESRSGGTSISERQIRSPEDEVNYYGMDDMDEMDMDEMDEVSKFEQDDLADYERRHGPGRFSGPGDDYDDDYMDELDYDEDGMVDQDDISDAEFFQDEMTDDLMDSDFDEYSDLEDLDFEDEITDEDFAEPKEMASRGMQEGVLRLMKNTKHIIENADPANKQLTTKKLIQNWNKHGRMLALESFTHGVRKTLHNIKAAFPGFKPINESTGTAMDVATGKSVLSNKMKGSPDLAEQPGPDEMTEHGDKNVLGHKHKNSLEGTPVIKGTAKGMSGTGDVTESKLSGDKRIMFSNVNKLLNTIKTSIAESVSGHKAAEFECYITESDGSVNKTPTRATVTESIADLEEVLQFHSPDSVQFVSVLRNQQGQIASRQEMPLATISGRGPVVAEGKALFRFKRNAELFAEGCNKAGVTCKIYDHGWGYAVAAPISFGDAKSIYATVSEAKWLQKAIDPEHEGYCTPMSKKTCTPRRKALAKRFKKGGDLYSGKD